MQTLSGNELPAQALGLIMQVVQGFNADPAVHGILVQLPLPKHINEQRILDAVSFEKDVDGFHPQNIGCLAMRTRDPLFICCTPKVRSQSPNSMPGLSVAFHGISDRRSERQFSSKSYSLVGAPSHGTLPTDPNLVLSLTGLIVQGCIELLERSGVQISGKSACVVGRSNIVGTPAAMLLQRRDATVTVVHSRTPNGQDICCKADIVIAACGKAEMITGDWIKEGAVVIDVGINAVDVSRPLLRLVKSVALVGDCTKLATSMCFTHPSVNKPTGQLLSELIMSPCRRQSFRLFLCCAGFVS